MEVPEVLLSGDHRKILDWRLKNSLKKLKRRPDLLKLYLDKKREKMNNILENYEKTHLESLINEKQPSFHPGDTVKVH